MMMMIVMMIRMMIVDDIDFYNRIMKKGDDGGAGGSEDDDDYVAVHVRRNGSSEHGQLNLEYMKLHIILLQSLVKRRRISLCFLMI